jgi:RNA polymerase sigma-70 factor, ECF subfamily
MTTTTVDAALKSLDDKTLAEMTVAGRDACFDLLMDRHLWVARKRVHAMVPDRAEVEDVLQEVQLKIWINLASFRWESSFRTWITRIAINESLQSYRRNKSTRDCDAMDFDRLIAPMDSPEECYARQEMAGALRKAIGRLPEKLQQIVMLRGLEELSVKETARELNSNLPLVKTRLFRARLRLSKVLRQYRKQPALRLHDRLAA